jgi:hypothetical protein
MDAARGYFRLPMCRGRLYFVNTLKSFEKDSENDDEIMNY